MNQRESSYLDGRRRLVDRELARLVELRAGGPGGLRGAIRHSLLAPSKRLRPLLLLAAAESLGRTFRSVLRAACAAELIHTYSLIHDDLPAMDDDALRRGRPASHKVFGEAVAILAGDGLLAWAFELLAGADARRPDRALEAVRLFAEAAGPRAMVGGQLEDLLAERRSLPEAARSLAVGAADPRVRVRDIHRAKTGALIAACVEAGGVLAGAAPSRLSALRSFGRDLGLAFQIFDDLADAAPASGRAEEAKLTFPSAFGAGESKRLAVQHARRASASLSPLGDGAWRLAAVGAFALPAVEEGAR